MTVSIASGAVGAGAGVCYYMGYYAAVSIFAWELVIVGSMLSCAASYGYMKYE